MARWFRPDSSRVGDFCRRLTRAHRAWEVGLAILGHALVVAVVACLVELLVPDLLVWALALGLVWLLGVALWTSAVLQPPLADVDRELGLKDRLLTYLGLERRARDAGPTAFEEWLQQDLESRLAAVPAQEPQRILRRPLGRLRYLVPLLVLLLLMRMFAPLPSWPDSRGPSMAAGGGGGGGASNSSQSDSSTGTASDTQPDEESAEAPPTPPPELPPEDQPEDPDTQSPAGVPEPPVEEVTVVDEFAIPQFVGDGDTRKQLTKLALVGEEEEDNSGGRRGASPKASAGLPEQVVPNYAKAREQAMRSRHVPLDERPFVKAYFDVLVEAAR